MFGSPLKLWLGGITHRVGRKTRKVRAASRRPLAAELLEAREVPATFTWSPTAPGEYDWNDAANWGNVGVPNATNDIANVSGALTGNQTITLDGNITLGRLNLGSTGSSGTYTLVANGGQFTFDVSAGKAAIVDAGKGGDSINAPIILADSLDVSSTGGAPLVIGGDITGTGTIAAIGTILQAGNVSVGPTVTLSGTGTFAATPVLYSTSYYDGALYEFNANTGSLLATLVAPNSSALLQFASGVAVGPDGNIYISNESPDPTHPSDSILQYNVTTQSLSTFIDNTDLQTIASAQGAATFNPSGIIFGPDGKLYVSLNAGFGDGFSPPFAFHGAVIRFDVTGSPGTLSYVGTNTAVATGIAQPAALAFGVAAGDTLNLYVNTAATFNVTKITGATGGAPTSAEFVTGNSANNGGLEFPSGLAWGPDGKLYVADLGAFDGQGKVIRYDSDGTFDKVFVATSGDSSSNGSLALQFPYGMLFNSQGDLILANFGNNGPTTGHPHDFIGSIYEYDPSGTFVTALVSYTKFPSTGPDASYSGIIPSQFALQSAPGIKVDAGGELIPGAASSGVAVSPGILTTSDVDFDPASALGIEMQGTTAGTGYGQLVSTGTVNLNNATFALVVAGGFTPAIGSTFDIVKAQTLNGIFGGLTDGTVLSVGGPQFQIHYTATDVILTRVQSPSITSAAGTTFITGASFNSFQVAANGSPTITFSKTGALPNGVTLSSSGLLSGTPDLGTEGTYPITITATNGITPSDTQNFTLTVLAGAAPSVISGDNTTFTTATFGTFTVTSTGTPTAALNKSGALPTGVSFVDNGDGTATLSGTPAAGTGGSYPFTITAANGVGSNATQSFTLTIDQPPAITSLNNKTLTTGTFGTFTVTTTGFPHPSLSQTTTLPSGVTFVDNGNGTATLSGTPAAGTGGAFPFTITAANGVGSNATQSFTLTIDQPPAITSLNSKSLTTGTFGTFTVTTTGFPHPSLSQTTTLPSGVTFVDNGNGTATLSGTPAAGTGGVYPFTITAANGIGSNATQSFTLTIDQTPAITSLNSKSLTTGTFGTFTVTTTGFPHPSLSQPTTLPSGVTFVDNGDGTATLSGTPAAGTGGSYPFTITAANGVGSNATQSFTLTIDQPPAITSLNNKTLTTGTFGTFTVTTTGFPHPSLSQPTTLPSGVTFVDNGNGTATLSGTPAAGTGGIYPFTITAANSVGSNASQAFTLTIDQAPAITSLNSTKFVTGVAQSFAATATGFPAPTFSTIDALPTGISLDPSGLIHGTTSATGDFLIHLTATNGVGTDASQIFTLSLGTPPAFTSLDHSAFVFGVGGTFPVAASGTPTPTLSETGSPPTGITFVPASGVLTVANSVATGDYTLNFKASNGFGADATQTFTLSVSNLVSVTPDLAVGGSKNGKATLYSPDASGHLGAPSGTVSIANITGTNVRTAKGDVDGDGIDDTILVTGPGVPIRVAVISGADNSTVLVQPFDPFGGNFTGGGFVSAGDFDGNGKDEFIVTPDRGGGPRVSIFALTNGTVVTEANYFTLDATFQGGIRTATGDVNGDGVSDLVVAAGFLGGPRVALINGTKALTTDGFNSADRLIGDFYAFEDTLRNGAYVAVGDVNGDGYGDLIFGAGPGGGPRVLTVDGKLLLSQGAIAAFNAPLSNFFLADDSTDRGGVRIGTINADGDGKADVVVATGENEVSFVRVYLGKNFSGGEPATFEDLNPFDSAALADGVYVG